MTRGTGREARTRGDSICGYIGSTEDAASRPVTPVRRPGSLSGWARSFERGLRLLGDRAERLRIVYGELRQHLAVERDLGLAKAGHELGVRELVLPRGGVDADDPQPPERPLLVLAVTVGVVERMLDLFLRVAVRGLLQPPVALRLAENLAALLARVNGTLDAWHSPIPSPAASSRS